MKKSPSTVSSNDLRSFADSALRNLEQPLAVTVEHDPVAMLVPARLFRELLREREILRRLAVGDLEFTAHDGYSLDEVLEDCELLLEEN